MKRLFFCAAAIFAALSAPAQKTGSEAPLSLLEEKVVPAAFPGGGSDKFGAWVEREYAGRWLRKYPGSAKMRAPHLPLRAVVSFCVDRQGQVTDVKVLQSPSRESGEMVADAVASSPEWTPERRFVNESGGRGKWCGVKAQYTLSIDLWGPVVKLWQEKQQNNGAGAATNR